MLRYGIIDYSRPSTEERFWVIDLSQGTLEYSELTSHGSGSQDPSDMRYADRFSNTNGSPDRSGAHKDQNDPGECFAH